TPTNTTYSVMTTAEMQTGTATTARTLSAARLKEAILYHAPSGSGPHTHEMSEITGLQSALDGKAASSHNHAASNITSGTLADARIPSLAISKITNLQTELNDRKQVGDFVFRQLTTSPMT